MFFVRYVYIITLSFSFVSYGMENDEKLFHLYGDCALDIQKTIFKKTIKQTIREKSLSRFCHLSYVNKQWYAFHKEYTSSKQKNIIKTTILQAFATPYTFSRQELCDHFGWLDYNSAGKELIMLVTSCSDKTENIDLCIDRIKQLSTSYPDVINYTWYQKEMGMNSLLMQSWFKLNDYELACALLDNGILPDSARYCNLFNNHASGKTVLAIVLDKFKCVYLDDEWKTTLLSFIKKLIKKGANVHLWPLMYTHNSSPELKTIIESCNVNNNNDSYDNINTSKYLYWLFGGLNDAGKYDNDTHKIDEKIQFFFTAYNSPNGATLRSYRRETPLQGYLRYYTRESYVSPSEVGQFLDNITTIISHKQCNLNARDFQNNNSLHTAARLTFASRVRDIIIERLINNPNKQKIQINAKNNYGQTCLHIVTKIGKVRAKTVNLLIGANADIDAIDNKGNTPLHYAVTNRNQYVVNLFIKKQALLNQVNDKGYTPLNYARKYIEIVPYCKELKNIAELLTLAGAITNKSCIYPQLYD